MMDNIDEVSDKRLQALKKIEKDKFRVARAYNKKVRAKGVFGTASSGGASTSSVLYCTVPHCAAALFIEAAQGGFIYSQREEVRSR